MTDCNLLGPWIRRFLLEHLVVERNFARSTQLSYRDTLTLLVPFVSRRCKVPIDRLSVGEVSPTTVRQFLEHVERERHCSVVTRNQRLGAIHSLARFIGIRAPEHLAWCTEIRSIPFKKTARTLVGYLEKPELEALLQAPDRSTLLGARDHALLLFLYNTGARADEAARLAAGNLQLGTTASVRILGKGDKWRICPLWSPTVAALRPLMVNAGADEPVFRGRTGKPLTRFGIHRIVTTYGKVASVSVPTMATKRVSPHTLRHTAAAHLLRAGVDINTIRAWLGHVSVDTTNIYAEVDIDMKAKALARLDITNLPGALRKRRSTASLIEFLRGL
jgi:site-specific recombinase XerD